MENWETIEEFPSYSVNELGEIYSHYKDKILKPNKNKYGYLKVSLYKDEKTYTRLVHRLVALAFLLNSENKPTIDHIDRDKTNNNVENLRWATGKEQELNKNYYHRKNNLNHHIILRKYGSYQVTIRNNHKIHRKCFKVLEEAIIYRDAYILENPK